MLSQDTGEFVKVKQSFKDLILFISIAFFILISVTAEAQKVRGIFLYNLSDFTGTIPYNWARVVADRERNEIYVLYQNTLRIFNESGMEVFKFGDDLDLGYIIDLSVDKRGDIYLLAHKDSKGEIIRCNFRGEPKSRVHLKDLPRDFSSFSPNRMIYHDENLYLASTGEMRIVISDLQGNFKKGYDLIPLLEREEKDRGNMEMIGFSVDSEGNILFTVPTLFRACVLSPDGRLDWFGRPGSIPGKFNIVAGITRDSRGNYLVVDKLKCTVMVFDRNFRFLTQFGYRGLKPGNLIAPDDIAIDGSERVYVTQSRKRGVSVFRLTYN